MRQLYERFDVDEETPVQFLGVYTTKWRPEWGQPEVMFREAEEQPCGHPAACIVSSDEGTSYCGWCAEVARLREALEEVEQDITGGDGRCPLCDRFLSAGHNDSCPFAALKEATE